ncbi:MAG: DUF58 domain-containing protein [Acidobacteria bacterium]|uniref:DUF58 domain-containing protein n=1 Tax=marine metagenome TaxID=408172 RepID=A0A381UVY7_9ZZZZ|nr:DUF58 domain-containing protein [Acidobacteriota bacterium]
MPIKATGGEVRFLDPAVVARIGSMELRARTVVEGFLSGLHRSPFKGFSVEFAEYRQYLPGDDLSTIDWKVYARSDRYYVKKFDEETNVECHLLLDVSGSMGYGSRDVTKLAYGSYLTASLAYLMNRQRDAVGFIAFDDNIVTHLPPSARPGHLRSVLLALNQLSLGTRSNVAKPLHQLADSLVKRGVVVLLSDLLDDPAKTIQGLKHLRFRGTDIVVFHLLDHDELTFPYDRLTRFRDMETSDEVMAAPLEVRDHYLSEIESLVSHYKRELGLVGIDYQLVDTSKSLDFALMSYLSTRSRRQ